MKYIGLLILMCLLAATNTFCNEQDAQAQAYQDIENKDYKILIYGEPLAENIDHIIYKDKKIKLERVAGCIVTDEQVKYWNAYNDIVQKELLEDNDSWKLIDAETRKIQNKK